MANSAHEPDPTESTAAREGEKDVEGNEGLETARDDGEKSRDGGSGEGTAAPTEKLGRAVAGDTLRRPLAQESSPLPARGASAPGTGGRLRDLTRAARGRLRERAALLAGFVRRHRAVSVTLAIMACVAVAFLGIAFVRAATLPSSDLIERDARALLDVPEFSGGTFGTDTPLVTQGVEIRSVARADTVPEGTSAAFGAAGYATAEVVVTYVGQSVSASRAATLTYALADGTWSPMPEVVDGGVAWHATGGVDQDKVLRNAHLLLARADEAADDDASLVSIYDDAQVTVESESFDEAAQTDTLELRIVREGAFLSYECRLTATFSFGQGNGQWSIAGATADDGARTPVLDGLLGTWTGTFQSQRTDGTKCLAGREAGLTLTIADASASGATGSVVTLAGELSGVAHYHAHPESDRASCEGDLALEGVAFSASLDEDAGEGGALTFVATLPEDVGGTVRLTLSFGAEGDPSRAEALVETSHPVTESILFIPYERTLTYTDVFALSRTQ